MPNCLVPKSTLWWMEWELEEKMSMKGKRCSINDEGVEEGDSNVVADKDRCGIDDDGIINRDRDVIEEEDSDVG